MPRVVDPAKIAHAAKLYASGKSFQQAAAEVGMDPESLRLILRRRGVVARPRHLAAAGWNRLPCPPGVAESYLAGESEKAIATRHGVSRNVVGRWLTEAGVERRTIRAANALHLASLTPEERMAKVQAAHAAMRARPEDPEHRARIAAGKERSGYGGRTSPGTDWLCEQFTALGVEHLREKAVGPYNLDIALTASAVAVEVLGGNWHSSKPVHAVRTPHILNAGWHLIFVWDIKRCQVGAGALDYLVTFAEQSRINPSPTRQYRVIRGDGQLLAAGQADDDDFPLVRPSVRGLNSGPRDERAG